MQEELSIFAGMNHFLKFSEDKHAICTALTMLLITTPLFIVRRATEVAERDGDKEIGMKHMMKAYQEMFTSPKVFFLDLVLKN